MWKIMATFIDQTVSHVTFVHIIITRKDSYLYFSPKASRDIYDYILFSKRIVTWTVQLLGPIYTVTVDEHVMHSPLVKIDKDDPCILINIYILIVANGVLQLVALA